MAASAHITPKLSELPMLPNNLLLANALSSFTSDSLMSDNFDLLPPSSGPAPLTNGQPGTTSTLTKSTTAKTVDIINSATNALLNLPHTKVN